MRLGTRATVWTATSAVWLLALGFGFVKLWSYEQAAGASAAAPTTLPSRELTQDSNQATLVMFMHPKCPCSRASVEELSKLMTDCRGKVQAIVFFVRPEGMPEGWEKTDLWTSAAMIPGVVVKLDAAGKQASQYGARTSGQALLYSSQGRLLFSGGITASRGHMGDNAGRSAVTDIVLGQVEPPARTAKTAVFGCPLFDRSTTASHGGA